MKSYIIGASIFAILAIAICGTAEAYGQETDFERKLTIFNCNYLSQEAKLVNSTNASALSKQECNYVMQQTLKQCENMELSYEVCAIEDEKSPYNMILDYLQREGLSK